MIPDEINSDHVITDPKTEFFPCLCDALRIASTLPVSCTTPERTFSKHKIIKNRLRTKISQERLEDLMLISCESSDVFEGGMIGAIPPPPERSLKIIFHVC